MGVFIKLPGSFLLDNNPDENFCKGTVVCGEIVVLTGCEAKGDAIGEEAFRVVVPAKGDGARDGDLPVETPELLKVLDSFVGAAFSMRCPFLLLTNRA